jgi:hypothetical protein
MQKNNKTQSERLAEKLQELKVDITKDDRDKAVSQLGLTIQTISHYLNGRVRQNDTAAKLIEFFSKRIARRDKVLN